MRLPSCNINQENIEYAFNNYNRLIVPSFQRGYSWDEEQIDDLFSDIIEGFKNEDEDLLIGNIVTITFNRKELLILDGQQRISTMFVIIEELSNKVVKYPKLKNILSSIYRNIDGYGVDFGKKLLRESYDSSYNDLNIPIDKLNYIINKVQELILSYENFEDKGSIIDYILSITFINQTYMAVNYKNKDEVLSNILEYFYKFNTRGKTFNEQETLEIVNKLKGLR